MVPGQELDPGFEGALAATGIVAWAVTLFVDKTNEWASSEERSKRLRAVAAKVAAAGGFLTAVAALLNEASQAGATEATVHGVLTTGYAVAAAYGFSQVTHALAKWWNGRKKKSAADGRRARVSGGPSV